MLVYRITKSAERAEDISGFGSFKFGGRWNSKGTYMLYTSINSSLAYLENLVHFDESNLPLNLYIAAIEIKDDKLIHQLPEREYPPLWRRPDNFENKLLGDKWVKENKHTALKVRSAINPSEYNFLLNPLHLAYNDRVAIVSVEAIIADARLIK